MRGLELSAVILTQLKTIQSVKCWCLSLLLIAGRKKTGNVGCLYITAHAQDNPGRACADELQSISQWSSSIIDSGDSSSVSCDCRLVGRQYTKLTARKLSPEACCPVKLGELYSAGFRGTRAVGIRYQAVTTQVHRSLEH